MKSVMVGHLVRPCGCGLESLRPGYLINKTETCLCPVGNEPSNEFLSKSLHPMSFSLVPLFLWLLHPDLLTDQSRNMSLKAL